METQINGSINHLSHLKDQKYKAMQAAFSCLLVEVPPIQMIEDYELTDSEALTSFCINHLRKEIKWSTGIGIVDAARIIADEAIGNANIGGEHSYFGNL